MKNLVIVAHPDDEAIWFSSVLKKPETSLVICFQNKYPSDIRNFDYTSRVFEIIELYREFIPILWLQTIKTTSPRIFGDVDPETKKHLKSNIISVLEITNPDVIYTHNPFGEYGHSEHVLVHEILQGLAKEKIKFPTYLIRDGELRSLEKELDSIEVIEVNPVDLSFRNKLFSWYKDRCVWTGSKGEPYGNEERFVRYK